MEAVERYHGWDVSRLYGFRFKLLHAMQTMQTLKLQCDLSPVIW